MILPVSEFCKLDNEILFSRISSHYQKLGGYDIKPEQSNAWLFEIDYLKAVFESLSESNLSNWNIAFEYKLPRINKWIDVVILTRNHVLVFEFKVGSNKILSADVAQTRDYVLDLMSYHKESQDKPVIGYLIPTEAKGQAARFFENPKIICIPDLDLLTKKLYEIISLELDNQPSINPDDWISSDFCPTPTIVEAAKEMFIDSKKGAGTGSASLYALHYAGAEESKLSQLTQFLVEIIKKAKKDNERHFVVISGVPGAGKTLAGLSLVFHPDLSVEAKTNACFLSGNGPLVNVLQDAIGYDLKRLSNRQYRLEYRGAVQNVHTFIDEEGIRKHPVDILDIEKIIVFDEAQRAWDKDHLKLKKLSKFRRHSGSTVTDPLILDSEPALMLRIMSKIPDWCVLIVLVGIGQEIWQGEAGLQEWGKALERVATPWNVHVSENLLYKNNSDANCLFSQDTNLPSRLTIQTDDSLLHLDKNLRSPRASYHNLWVDSFLDRNIERAKKYRGFTEHQEIFVTRSLDDAKLFMRRRVTENETVGILASSDATLLRRLGIELSTGFRQNFNYAKWFNIHSDDVRACRMLEVAATQFECQGLDLDHAIVVWGEDFLPALPDETGSWIDKSGWSHRKYQGAGLSFDNAPNSQKQRLNAYRVLLTRARKSLIIVVPPPPSKEIRGCKDKDKSYTLDVRMDRLFNNLIDSGLPKLSIYLE